MKITRRNFLKGSALTTAFFLSGFNSPIYSYTKNKKNLVIISLRGAMDGLSAIPVIGDKNLQKKRPDIIIPEDLKLNSDFAIHPALKTFHDLWKGGKSAFVHATNIPYTGRSHFDGQNLMESGGRVPYKTKTGWLGRAMKLAKLKSEGLALGLPMPLLLRGVEANDNYYPSGGSLPDSEFLKDLSFLYGDRKEHNLKETMDTIRKRDMGKRYSRDDKKPKQLALSAAKIMSKPNGPRVAVFEVGGFDTHAAQGGIEGTMSDQLKNVDDIVLGMKEGLGENFENTLILTLTEFGRKVAQNSGYGTEHGYGSAILMAGGLLKKAQVHTDWPGLETKFLFEKRDLNSTIDARGVYASALSAVFDLDFNEISNNVFSGEKIPNLSDRLFII